MNPLYSQMPTLIPVTSYADPANPGNRILTDAIITGVPPTTYADIFGLGCTIKRTDSTTNYINTGTIAVPVWSPIENSESGFTLPLVETDATTTTGTSLSLTTSTLTTGVGEKITAAAATTGKIFQAIATAATLTTGRYFSANDGAVETFGIGANGHIHTAQTTAPTIAVTTANGITASAITAGASDTCGIITTTGTNNAGGSTVLDVTFNKTYTTAPKSVVLTPRNASAAKAAATSLALPFISATSATGFTITIPSDASAGATPSYAYMVIA